MLEGSDCKPLGFFSRLLSPSQAKYSNFDHELLVMYESVKFFGHMLVAWNCQIVIDHKLIVEAFHKVQDTLTNEQARWLSYITVYFWHSVLREYSVLRVQREN